MIITISSTELSGVYCIINRITGRRYVGQSQSIQRRWEDHRMDLCQGKHVNKALQAEWFEYGSGAFSFILLEIVQGATGKLRERERVWFKRLDVFNGHGFNKAR